MSTSPPPTNCEHCCLTWTVSRESNDFRVARTPNKYVAVGFFTDYRLRMAEITRDYTATDRTEAPVDSRSAHDHGATH